MTQNTMNFSVIVVSNNDEILETTLLVSPDLKDGIEIVIERNAISAAVGYNAGIKRSRGDILVFVHQDAYLPKGWFDQILQAVDFLNMKESCWGVLGVYGRQLNGTGYGHLYSTGLGTILGEPVTSPISIQTLDEVVLVVRRSNGLWFDEKLPGFHLYGADICLEARQRGLTCHVVEAFCIHNSRGITFLPWAYWQAWLYIRRKWWHELPIMTPTLQVTRFGVAALRYLIQSLIIRPSLFHKHQHSIGQRTKDPDALWKKLCSKDPNYPFFLSLKSHNKN
ncbi:MAG: glycosyltransferase [Methylococcaceae bacterium]|jgi:GT2 family glycosyltransferase